MVSVPPLPLNTSVASNAAAAVPETIQVSLPEPPYKESLAAVETLFG